MKLSSISYNQVALKGQIQSKQNNKTQDLSAYKTSPLAAATTTAGGAFVLSYGIDRIVNLLFKLDTTRKHSAAFSAILGLGLGAYTYYQTKKEQKLNNV